ncbi:protein of unknown function [Kyrpidia spormannii]|uniref:Uncharacterized protein n=2 Tax=Kyrpidia spormannii TaxID=2055160 RepID=A0ACA8ZE29_9BACL|nr:protein of unknown function [Kyrpidia spormannii]CAB3396339.1 protein of unknown function [Kyrpidia spormannii]
MVEHLTFNQGVAGSSPAWLTNTGLCRTGTVATNGAGIIGDRDGRLAQRESTRFTREGSLVRSQYRPPFLCLGAVV